MFYLRHLIIFAFISALSSAYAQSQQEVQNEVKKSANELEGNGTNTVLSDRDTSNVMHNKVEITAKDDGKVEVKLYYECLCPYCISFIKEQFSPAFQKLSQYVDFHIYPYGNAETIKKNGVIEFICQHGPPECYGNKLHACAIDHLKNITEAVTFNSCMMGEEGGSEDAAADRCAAALGIDSTPIKSCAKGDRGTELLEYYGEESKKVNLPYVPYITINGQENDGNFLRNICAAFAVSPPPCVEEVQNEVKKSANELEDNGSTVFSDRDTLNLINNKVEITAKDDGKVEVKLYYECLCPYCISFIKEQFSPAFQKLSQYVDFHIYPYGNAETIKKNGVIEFICQHGPPECYGNKLHACAIDHLKNITEAVTFNSCMMGEEDGSEDAAADRCAAALGIDSTPIKSCAKGDRGTELLEYYGEESKKVNLPYVPYITINGQENDGNFLRNICAAFAVSPPPCVEEVQNEVKKSANELEDNGSTVFSDRDTLNMINNKVEITAKDDGKVEVKLYYECLCPYCISFIKEQFSPAFQKLSQYVDFHIYPYGNAETIKKNGVIEFICQHGPSECYGNKLHACAIDHLKNITEAVTFNSCMMGEEDGSEDAAADRCAAALGIDSTPIKSCAKGDRGTELLEYYGEESKKVNLPYVPYITINGQENEGNFLRNICAAFAVSPPPCV